MTESFQMDDAKSEKKNEKRKKNEISYFQLFRYSTILDKIYIGLGIILSAISGITQLWVMIIFGDVTGVIVDYAANIRNATLETDIEGVEEQLFDGVQAFGVYVSVLGVVSIITNYLASVFLSYSALRQIFQIRKLFLESMLNQDISWYDVNKTGDFASSFTDNISKIEEGIGDKICMVIFHETIFVVGICVGLILGWELTLVCLVSLPLSGIAMGLITWLSTKFTQKEAESYSEAGSIADEVLSSIRTVIAFEGQQKELSTYEKYLNSAKKNNIKKSLFSGIANGANWLFVYSCCALSFWYGINLILDNRNLPENERIYTAGKVISIFFCTLMASWNFASVTPYLEIFGTAKGAAVKIFRVLDNRPSINMCKNLGKEPLSISGEIRFDDVYFNYPARSDVKILQGFSLRIKPGETVALVGSSGCGKSTCIQLIQRFYDAIGGNIYIDENNIKDLNLTWLRHQIGMVGQEPALFATTISENIRLGNLSATQEDIEKAAIKSNAHNFIMKLPHKYETVIGERGAQLSGGQKQRIAIARALVRNPKILLLDEATSALDTTSEAEVQAALDAISGERTTIIVAHRLSTIRNANRIVVVAKGKVVEEGNHEELMNAKKDYYNLVISQCVDAELDLEDHKLRRVSTVTKINSTNEEVNWTNDIEVKESKVEKPKSSILEVLKANRPEWFFICLGCVTSIINGAALPVYGMIYGDITGVLADQNDAYVRQQVNLFCLFFVILGIVSGLATLIQMYSFGVAGEKLTCRLRSKTFQALLNQEMGWFDRKENGVGALCAKLSGDAASVQGAGGVRIGSVFNSISTFLIAITFSLYYEWKLSLVLMSFSSIILVSVYFEQKFTQSDSQNNQKFLEESAKIAVEAIGNIRTVASLGCEKNFYDCYVVNLKPYQKNVKKKTHFRAAVFGVARSIMLFAYAVGMGYGAKLIVDEKIEYGIVFKVTEIMIVGSWSIGNAFTFSPNFQKGLEAAARIFQLLARVPEIRSANDALTITNIGNVQYNKIHFSYPTRPSVSVLNGLDLSVIQGKTVALVGSSGCGKSTITQLLLRYYDPKSGQISVDGTNTRIVQINTLRSFLSIVSQEPNLFNRTISENIAYGANSRVVSAEDIKQSAKSANIHNFISSLPLGYDTLLGNKGTQLSGGQKQRIAIARALIRNPCVLLLDEATSALDNESEKLVQEALDKARENRTCITIAHRLTTIQNADIICTLHEGGIAEMGRHAELLEKRGLYYKFFKAQSGQK